MQRSRSYELMITHHMSDGAISATVLAIKTYRKFKSLRARIEPYDSLLQLDNQISDNDEIFDVLCYMARPTTQHEMDNG